MGGVPPANGGAGRLNELLEQIRAEFESHVRQTETYEHQSRFYPSPAASTAALWMDAVLSARPNALTYPPVQAQVQEMQMIREKVYQMEQAQIGLKQK
jgi:glucose repression regulatory protein TUP1